MARARLSAFLSEVPLEMAKSPAPPAKAGVQSPSFCRRPPAAPAAPAQAARARSIASDASSQRASASASLAPVSA
jgi:hypothetical protein